MLALLAANAYLGTRCKIREISAQKKNWPSTRCKLEILAREEWPCWPASLFPGLQGIMHNSMGNRSGFHLLWKIYAVKSGL